VVVDDPDEGPATTLAVVGDLEAATVSAYRRAMADLAGTAGRRDRGVVLDLSAVTFIDSAGLGALVGTIRRQRERGVAVAVCSSRPRLNRLLATIGFDRIVPIADSRAEAAAFLGSAGPDPDGQTAARRGPARSSPARLLSPPAAARAGACSPRRLPTGSQAALGGL